MVKQYFGTDGIRGRVGVEPMTPDNVLKLGWAAGKVLAKKEGRKRGKVLIGKDTRISGYMMESLLEAGFSAAGVDSRLLGPMPTPAIAYLTRTFRASAGVVISASHNPYYDNGVKFFDAKGEKLPDDVELDIEAQMQETMQTVDSADIGKVKRLVDATGRYIEFCKSTVPTHITFSGLKIVVDCAHGASYSSAPNVFRELGATVIELGVKPNGLNINKEYGATAPEKMREAVLKHKADLGVALDGDGDRLILVDHLGNIVDGDQTLFIISKHKHLNNSLAGGVVGTQMTNYGLEKAFAQQKIDFVRAKVGDRYVMEELRARNWMLGGESSGHIICLDCTTTGDGIIAALQVLRVMMESEKSLHELAGGFTMYPQIMLNVPIKERFAFEDSTSINSAVKQVEDKLKGSGRVLLRASGTEPLIRVMVEGEELVEVSEYAQHIADAVQKVCA